MKIRNNLGHEIVIPKNQEATVKAYIAKGNYNAISKLVMGYDQQSYGGAISDTGDTQMMYPGEDYEFDGESVTEYPMMQNGGWLNKYK